MRGAIVGDIIGSRFEHAKMKSTYFDLIHHTCRFTDDSVLTLAVADAAMNQRDYGESIKMWAQAFPRAGYGHLFRKWMRNELADGEYTSFGNGSAMRVSSIGWLFNDLETVLEQAKLSAMPTHSHPEGIKGAQAIAACVLLARQKKTKEEIRQYVTETFDYDLNRTIEEIRPEYRFDVTCQGSVPESIIAFLDSTNFEESIRLGISLGGDADTIAAMAGGISEAFYGPLSQDLSDLVDSRMTMPMKKVLLQFEALNIPGTTFGKSDEEEDRNSQITKSDT